MSILSHTADVLFKLGNYKRTHSLLYVGVILLEFTICCKSPEGRDHIICSVMLRNGLFLFQVHVVEIPAFSEWIMHLNGFTLLYGVLNHHIKHNAARLKSFKG